MTGGARRLLIVVALVVVAYLPFIGGGLLTDDYVHLDRLTHASPGEVIAAPDAFGFFRPATQAFLYLDSVTHPSAARLFRLTNVVLHGLVLTAAYVVARLVMSSVSAAALATLIFALTPKAHPIAVLWISARGELLMALFALVATAAWIVWTRGGSRVWAMTAIVAYALAILSKETAFLLPLALLIVPGATVSLPRRTLMACAMAGVAALAFALRIEAGALVPGTSDPHYTLATSLVRWGRNARNYAGRLLPEPLAAMTLLGIAGMFQRRAAKGEPGTSNLEPRTGNADPGTRNVGNSEPGTRNREQSSARIAAFSLVWVFVFLIPVLPVVLRNELYLYLPAFGIAMLAAQLVARWVDLASPPASVRAAMLVFAIAGGAYQLSRSWEMHDELLFSGRLVEALAAVPRPAVVSLVAEDDTTGALLKDTIGGYLPAVLRQAAPDGRVIAADPQTIDAPGVMRLRCGYHDGRVVITRN